MTGNSSASSFVPDEGSVEQLINFGFTRPQCVKALKCTNGSMERAADWLFNHPDDTGKIILVFGAPVLKMILSLRAELSFNDLFFFQLGEEPEPEAGPPNASNTTAVPLSDGSPKYKLVAFISHMGTSTMVGHYVCHILKEGRWVIYNDEKVAISEKTPRKLGYLYLYERIPS